MRNIRKKILSQQLLIYGDVSMPEGWDIDAYALAESNFRALAKNKNFIFSRTWDMLNTYIRENINLEYNIRLINLDSWGNIYIPNEKTEPLLNIDKQNLSTSPDFTCLYGINTSNCNVSIFYDDNKRKGKRFDMELKHNMFMLFPSSNMYLIDNKQQSNLNFVQTITYRDLR